jgi:hypothetical protein
MYWIFIILFLGPLGAAIYILVEVIQGVSPSQAYSGTGSHGARQSIVGELRGAR